MIDTLTTVRHGDRSGLPWWADDMLDGLAKVPDVWGEDDFGEPYGATPASPEAILVLRDVLYEHFPQDCPAPDYLMPCLYQDGGINMIWDSMHSHSVALYVDKQMQTEIICTGAGPNPQTVFSGPPSHDLVTDVLRVLSGK